MTPERSDEKVGIVSSQQQTDQTMGISQDQQQLQRDPKIDEDGEEGETKHNVSFCDQNDLMRSVQTKLFL